MITFKGENIISVEIHQVSESSSDISFDLELIGTSYSNIVLLDSISYQGQVTDVSHGRTLEQASWFLFGEPTPGLPNDTPTCSTTHISSNIEFSLDPGFYDSPQTIELFSDDPIYYTLDGTTPGSNDIFYIDPIMINNTTVLKARSIGINKLPSRQQFQLISFLNKIIYLPYP